eukprot:SAG11_NODE_33533_length_276_cov_10.937853_1_plen_46_part_01
MFTDRYLEVQYLCFVPDSCTYIPVYKIPRYLGKNQMPGAHRYPQTK